MRNMEAILVCCGSFSPPTYMHLRMFEIAKDALKKRNINIVSGIISPCNDGYNKKELASGVHRVAMSKLAISTNDWLKVDEWEALEAQGFQFTINVLKKLQNKHKNVNIDEIVNKQYLEQNILTMWGRFVFNYV